MGAWDSIIRNCRLRNGMSQASIAAKLGVSQRTVSRWERGEDNPSLAQQRRLREIGWEPEGSLLHSLRAAILHCPAPRALTRGARLNLIALSRPAIEKRPLVVRLIGRDLAPMASGVLAQMLDDAPLQRAIERREISAVVATTHSVLRTGDAPRTEVFRTTINYFFHDGTRYNDALSLPTLANEKVGYIPVPMDTFGAELPSLVLAN
jgi:transcriptional regulator with XRE-family HTH domain